ncbi:hypothetical protein [Xanthomonas graminis]|jgi:hypothetical protein|uniref:hypothetical protein n=1 Tax=Xanthomonas graminis TaxID=3390026 RepID=UPI000B036A20|nr:hypothetical protein [Xanthomonas translucens]
MLSLNSDSVPDYVAAVLREIERCIGTFTIQVPETSDESILDQIHALKNALAASGTMPPSSDPGATCETWQRSERAMSPGRRCSYTPCAAVSPWLHGKPR